tara:strand:+ start:4941 stop:6356 length:1416 start_codon:yes stop_codon:yes gene_type:complete
MIFDLNNQNKNYNIKEYDIVIIGSGPAGISIAQRLVNSNLKILVAEGGDKQFTIESSNIYKGEVKGDPYYDLIASRLRYFGGTSNHWTGYCRTLDEHDFEYKDDYPIAYWPISKSDLDPYLKDACKIVEISSKFNDSYIDNELGIKSFNFNFSPRVKFGEKFEYIFKKDNIDLIRNCNLVNFKKEKDYVSHASFTSFNKKLLDVKANKFVLATGGIENSRLLLAINEKNNFSLFDRNLPIGKYWMDHPHFTIGEALSKDDWKDKYLCIDSNSQRRLKILNCGIRMEGVFEENIKGKIKEIACYSPELGKKLFELANKKLLCNITVRAAWEQEPLESNRIELSRSSKDVFGMPRTVLYYKKSKNDLNTVRKTIEQIAKYGINKSIGRIKLKDFVLGKSKYPINDQLGGPHHIGGTRMSDSSNHGVVDKNAKIFTVSNLYVMGSSVFPTGGHANPTLTIVQLSLRLGDHLLKT